MKRQLAFLSASMLFVACNQKAVEQVKRIPEKWPDTNLVRAVWERELSSDKQKLHKEGVEEFLAITVSLNTGPWLRSESEIAFLSGRALVALSKLDMKNELDRTAYRRLLTLSLFGRERSILAAAAYRWGDLTLSQEQYRWLKQALANQRRVEETLKKMRQISQRILLDAIPGTHRRKPLNTKVLRLI